MSKYSESSPAPYSFIARAPLIKELETALKNGALDLNHFFKINKTVKFLLLQHEDRIIKKCISSYFDSEYYQNENNNYLRDTELKLLFNNAVSCNNQHLVMYFLEKQLEYNCIPDDALNRLAKMHSGWYFDNTIVQKLIQHYLAPNNQSDEVFLNGCINNLRIVDKQDKKSEDILKIAINHKNYSLAKLLMFSGFKLIDSHDNQSNILQFFNDLYLNKNWILVDKLLNDLFFNSTNLDESYSSGYKLDSSVKIILDVIKVCKGIKTDFSIWDNEDFAYEMYKFITTHYDFCGNLNISDFDDNTSMKLVEHCISEDNTPGEQKAKFLYFIVNKGLSPNVIVQYLVNEKMPASAIYNFIQRHNKLFNELDLSQLDEECQYSILRNAFQEGNCKTIQFFIENIADINFKDSSGHTPFYYAKDSSLSARMIKKYATLESLSENTSGDLLNKLLTKCKTNVVDTNQKEELHDKVKNGLEEVLKNKAIYEILNIAANSEYEITFLSQKHNSVVGFSSPDDKNTFVFNACESSKISIIDTIVHEFTHLVMSEIFKNNSNPYYKTNNKNELFINLAKQSIEACPEAFNIITDKEFYSEDDYPRELIAYYFGALATDILSGSKILAETFGSYSNLVVALTESMQVVNEDLKSSDLLTTLDYHSDCFDGFFEEMLGMNSIENSED